MVLYAGPDMAGHGVVAVAIGEARGGLADVLAERQTWTGR